ncbi:MULTISPECIES: type II secretion system inner membrane protein GspF [unclassified Pseudomonas]|uniref:type II secretion system inner membrane protein GspF n=1 Tax=unclassified Pseudomonas TaxID=196821 RepID=UPI0021C62BE5|nr:MULTISPECIES: type II secretion system inner membrane protein GspF [unclassified Pseudomonas]MCU1722280.1 type II secretion system inner membrane protein GspF [Pseudomonas sp. 5P_5.1_Bac1]MCU1730562.1 type II secretion system inner membrane protein GspF [Pseudomonas sp. 20P_3.2_Bac4]MCU1745505.1 type II secretion system inner membrane protein GspF [Pseudomonas sp. 20P_3.2_Bac5]
MNRYRFEAADASGKIESGHLEADSQSAALGVLRSRGLTALSVQQENPAAHSGSDSLFSPRLSDNDLAWATRQLASLLSASLPLEAALSATVEQSEKKHIAHTLSGVRADVRSGMRLAEALAARPRDFPEIYRALIAAGEESGDLAQVMERLADYIEERNNLRSKILTAFIYPGVVGLVSIGIVIFLLSYVVPQVVSAFSQARQDLPWLTLAMLNASDFIRTWGWLCAAVMTGAFWSWRLYLRNPTARLSWHHRVLKLPLIGRFVLGLNTARFASTLAILGGAGVPLLRALEAARQTLSNERLSLSVSEATARVREGANLAAALKVENVFPPLLIHLIASGEKTGSLPPMLERAAQTLSRDIERRAMGMTALLEPLMIVVMGGVVLVIVMAVLLPIIEINQLVQ